MSRKKDKKLNKLKKLRITPYIFSIFACILVFSVLGLALAVFLFFNLFVNKTTAGYEGSKGLADYAFSLGLSRDSAGLTQFSKEYINVSPDTTDICIVDSSYRPRFRVGSQDLIWNKQHILYSRDDVVTYLTEDENSLIYYKDGNIYPNFSLFLSAIYDYSNSMMENREELPLMSDSIGYHRLWYRYTYDDHYVFICQKISITTTEILSCVAAVVVFFIAQFILVLSRIVSVINVIFERRKIRRILDTDMVTGGNNLSYFSRKGAGLLRHNRNDWVIVLFRLQKYRNYCSCFGPMEGEELLEQLYEVLFRSLRGRELLAHEEKADFVLLLQYTTIDELEARLQSMITRMERIKPTQRLSFHIGICVADKFGKNPTEMINMASVAAGLLQDGDKKIIAWFTEDMYKEERWQRTVKNETERAIANKEFQVYIQPKYSTRGEKLCGGEALVRWIHPTEGFVAPYRFIPILEANGDIIALDDYMISETARLQAQWIAEGKEVVPISVNLSRANFIRNRLADHICGLVDAYHIPHHLIELELTESAFFDDKEVLLSTIDELKAKGFEISMDDFGSGYSSLNSLKELPLDVLKLDAGFFRNEDKDGRSRLIVSDTISLAKKLNMRIVAEGIETKEQVDYLATLDCDLIQGYYFAKPMPAMEFEERLKMTIETSPVDSTLEADTALPTEAISIETTDAGNIVSAFETSERKTDAPD